MRSTNFVILSILLHGLCAMALILTPIRTISPENSGESTNVEVQIDTPAKKAGTAVAPDTKQDSTAQTTPKPKPHHVAQVKPAVVQEEAQPLPKKDTVTEPTPETTVAAVEDKVEEPRPAKTAVVEDSTAKEPQEKETLVPVKETVPAGVEAATSEADTEAKSEDVQNTSDPAPVAVSEEPAGKEELTKGGAAKESAVSYLDLRQMPGNKPPQYPLQARLDKRQGQLELVYRVTKDGKVTDIQVVKSSGFKDLDSEAVRAIAQYRFVPGQEGWARHPVSYALKGPVATLPSRLRAKGAQND